MTEIIAFSDTPVCTCYLLSFGNLVVNPVHILLTENVLILSLEMKEKMTIHYKTCVSNVKHKPDIL
jgi:hypothetical protein